MKELSWEEIELIEELSGLPFDWLARDDKPKFKLIRAFVCVIKRRTEPGFTLEDAAKVSQVEAGQLLDEIREATEAADPKE